MRRVARMSVDPDSAELFRPATRIDLIVKEVGHRLVVELDVRPSAGLLDELDIFDK
jgi:hypothetical protein